MKKNGFTLIELMVVVIVIAVLAVFAFSSYKKARQNAEYDQAKLVLAEIGAAYQRMQMEMPGANLSGAFSGTASATCKIAEAASYLISCGYMDQKTWANYNYTFSLGAPATGETCLTNKGAAGGLSPIAYMTAKTAAGSNYTAGGEMAAIYCPFEGVEAGLQPN